jgi:hopanoid biosynthesis associated protein HpnK
MVGAPAAADAIERARRLPSLKVGLHIVLIDGAPLLPNPLLAKAGRFDTELLRTGLRYFFRPGIRRALSAEIRAQFEAFRATGLALDHVDSHKHMHLHPTVARLIVEIGRDFGMRAMRVPDEPVAQLRRASRGQRRHGPMYRATNMSLRRRLRRAGIASTDHVFGLAWSGGMDEARILALLPHLPAGTSEIYCHPAVERSPDLETGMPGYRNTDEFAALISPGVRRRIAELGIGLIGYGELTPSV